jgi:uncharacterized membrane protein YphA (DoxX/SURF4 family)
MNSGWNAKQYAPVVLRFGLVALFLWFGLSQVISPSEWVSWLPSWTSSLPLGAKTLVLLNGGFEVIFGALLALGIQTRWVALLLSLHLFLIAYEIGYNDVGVRDFVLSISTLAIALFGADRYTLDEKRRGATMAS